MDGLLAQGLDPAEQQLALSQGLLGLGAGLLSGSYGHYGAFAPALSSGAAGFQQGYGNAIEQNLKLKAFKQQQMLQNAQIGNYNSEVAKRQADMDEQRRLQAIGTAADAYASGPPTTPMVPKTQSNPMAPVVTANAPAVFNDQAVQGTPISQNQIDVTAPTKSKLESADYWAKSSEYKRLNGDQKGALADAEMARKIRAEDLGLSKDERDKPVEGLPGFTFNPKAGTFKKDGNAVSADEVLKAKIDLANAGATRVQTNVNAQLPASEAAQKDFIDKASKNYDSLRNAPTLISNFQQIRDLVPKAGTFVGSFGDKKAAIAQFFNNNFGTTIDPAGVANSKELQTRLFYQIMDNLKKMDAQPSELQQKLMQDALGNINVDPAAIPKIVDVAEQTLRDKVALHNKEVNSAISRGVKFPFDPVIQLPARTKGGTAPLSPSEQQELNDLRKRFTQ